MINNSIKDNSNSGSVFEHEINSAHYSQSFDLYRNNGDRVNQWCNYFLEAVGSTTRNVFLDCGCGVGRFTLPMSSFFCQTYGVDLSSAMLDVACRKSNSIKWIKADVRSIPLPNEFVDVALASMLIEHIDSLDSFFAEMQRITKQEGVVLIRTMLPDDIDMTTWYSFSQEAKQLELKRAWSYDEICIKLSQLGFNICKTACRFNVIEESSDNIISRLESKSYEILYRLSDTEYKEMMKKATDWKIHNSQRDVMSSTLLVFRKERKNDLR